MNKKSLSALVLYPLLAFGALAEGVPALQIAPVEGGEPSAGQGSQPVGTATNSGVSELYFMLQQLQSQVQLLTGKIEKQAYQIKQLKKQGLSRYRDLDGRLLSIQHSNLSVSPPVVVSSPVLVAPPVSNLSVTDSTVNAPLTSSAVATNQPSSDEQKRLYAAAFEKIKSKQFEAAVAGFHAFIEKYPSSDLTGNAYYWLGEVYLVLPKLEQAKDAFTVVVASFPNHRKAPDALFKLGVTLHRMGQLQSAKNYLNDVITKYPQSSAARLSAQYIKKL